MVTLIEKDILMELPTGVIVLMRKDSEEARKDRKIINFTINLLGIDANAKALS